MSSSETADRPSDATISRTLCDVVLDAHKSGNTDHLTVKRVRAKAEEKLGLDAGFFKASAGWKNKSDATIREAFAKYCGDDAESEEEPVPKAKSKPAPKKAVKPEPPKKKTKTASEKTSGVKRKSAAPAKKPQKRRKVSSDEESDAAMSDASVKEDTPSEAENKPPKKNLVRRGKKKVVTEDSDEDEDTAEKAKPMDAILAQERETTPIAASKGDQSDSEMSILIDESPAKKKRSKDPAPKKRGKEPKTKAAAKPKASASKSKVADSPDQAEIKRLQSWLVKCGIRKVWVRELANCDTEKEKIKHLKVMLKDAGMDGKYSNERAAAIKEQREFAKDLEAIQEGAKAWGEDVEDTGRPRRRLNRGVQKPLPKYDVDEEEDEEEEEGNGGAKDEANTQKDEQGEEEAKPKPKPKLKPKPKAENPSDVETDAEDDDEGDFEAEDDDSDDEVKFSSEDGGAADDSE